MHCLPPLIPTVANVGPVYMVSSSRGSPPPRSAGFTELLHENRVTEKKLALLRACLYEANKPGQAGWPSPVPGSFISPPKGREGRKTLVQASHMSHKKVAGDKNSTGGRCTQVAILSFLNPLWNRKICLKRYHILHVIQHELRGQMSKTPKKIYAASSNAKSYCRLCKSVGYSAHCKNLFGKAKNIAAEEAVPLRGVNSSRT